MIVLSPILTNFSIVVTILSFIFIINFFILKLKSSHDLILLGFSSFIGEVIVVILFLIYVEVTIDNPNLNSFLTVVFLVTFPLR